MSQQTIGIGSIANDGLGDPLRTAFTKVNANDTELYAADAARVVGPSSATDDTLVKFDGTTGKLVKQGPAVTSFAATLLDDADAATARTTLGVNTSTELATETKTLTNKTLTAPVISTIVNSGTLTLPTSTGTLALTSDITGTNSGTNTGDQFLFRTISVSGQSDIVADSTTDTLTLVAGGGVTLTTNATTDSLTIALASGAGSGDMLAGNNLSDLTNTATARTNLGVAIGTNVQAYDADLDSWSSVTRAAGFDTFAATPSSANLASLVTNETGSGALVFATSPTLVTPALGVATATSINKVAITAPATGATLTIPDGVTLTGPAASDTLVGKASTDTLTNKTLTSPTINGATVSGTFTGTLTLSGVTTHSVAGTPLVAKSTDATERLIELQSNSTVRGLIGANSSNCAIFYSNASSAKGIIDNTSGAYTALSDERQKTAFDQGKVNFGIAIDGLWVGDFEFKEQPGNTRIGVRAQQAYEHFPIGVSPPKGDIDVWMACHSDFGYLALWGVKDLRKRVTNAEAAIAALVAEFDAYKAAHP